MSDSDDVKNKPPAVDGFEGFEDRIEGDDQQQSGRVIQGERWQFTNDFEWLNDNDEVISREREVVVLDIARVLQRWLDQKPVETTFLAPGERIPDVKKLNEAAPKTEWSEGPDGKLRGPWQFQYVVYMVDMQSMEKITYPTGTTGGGIAVRELADKVKLMRKFRGANVHPVVSPADKHMNTRFGGRQRPHFLIRRWISLGSDGTALPAPSSPPLLTQGSGLKDTPEGKSEKKSESQSEPLSSGARVVEEPTLAEQMDDQVPW